MAERSSAKPRARTLLEQQVWARRQTFEEFAEFAEKFAREHDELGTLSVRHLQRLAAGQHSDGSPLGRVQPATARLLERIFGVSIGELLAPPTAPSSAQLFHEHGSAGLVAVPASNADEDDERAAIELARRVSASDVGQETLDQLEAVVDDLAVAYSVTPPQDLLGRIRMHLGYVTTLLDARKTLDEHRRLLVVGGWLSLLGATVHIDLKQQNAATARVRTTASLAKQAGHDELYAWCFETEAWRMLTAGNYAEAVSLAQAAQQLAPRGSSAALQATAQEGRARARLGQRRETYAAISRVARLVAPLPEPHRPEHHYHYDPDKVAAYTATTLAWVGDPAAENYAREVLAKLKGAEDLGRWPRRVASANLDLALALVVSSRLDEAVGAAHEAISSGRVVPSNHWRALEVVRAVEARQVPEGKDLREAYEEMCWGARTRSRNQ
ncbi:MAG TPA: XRE family transcriptional regulator [Mycobacteriales bacterium]|nr:XRE family transcriptional regulator [Mycobacteriales bacterium]